MNKEFSVIMIPTFACNNRCLHCFEEIKNETIKSEMWPIIWRELKNLARARAANTLKIYWQGGELMTMGPALLELGLRTGDEYFDESDIALEHHIQTNLLLYDGDWRHIINSYFKGSISSSIDFPNLYRRAPALTLPDYTAAWIKKKNSAELDGFIVNIITLPNTETLRLGAEAFYEFFVSEINAKNVQINFPFMGFDGENPAALPLEELAEFMADLYGVWVKSGRYLNLNPFAALENRISGNDGRLPCAWAYNCSEFLIAVAPNGEVGLCDCWISTQRHHNFGKLGAQSLDEILASPKRAEFLERPNRVFAGEDCADCRFWMICHGGCPIRSFSFKGSPDTKDYYCVVYKSIFNSVLGNKQEEAKDEIVGKR